MIAFFNGRYVPKGEVAIWPDDRGFLFADGLYEVVRLCDGRPFRPAEHFARLARRLVPGSAGGRPQMAGRARRPEGYRQPLRP